jgi:hypothetical protein
MEKELNFGEVAAQELSPGDIVEWQTWNTESEVWNSNYGIIIEIKNQIKSNRMISISKVMPVSGLKIELEFFTMSLKLVSRSDNNQLT